MRLCLQRREFIAGLASAAGWPLYASAQQPAIPVIGYLFFGSPAANASAGLPAEAIAGGFRRRLKEAGYDEGRNIAIEFRWGNNQDRLLELAADLVRRQPPRRFQLFSCKAPTR